MRYVSTRDGAERHSFEDVLLEGLARDGGLYVPESWPSFSHDDIAGFAALSYDALAARVLAPLTSGAFDAAALAALTRDAYRGFDHQAVTPLIQIAANEWVLELHHGPTLAFKDLALQIVGRMFDAALAKRGGRITVVGATSGDTGSAAIEACRERENVDIFMMHPAGRVSEVQRRQMTTVRADNVHNIAVEGTFDDCQALVKALFADHAFRDRHRLSAVNSINWARVAAQTVYYFAAAAALGAPHRAVQFSVPTGNFGDVYAGYAAARMGLSVERLVIATNLNDILARAFASGRYELAKVTPTMSPSMDIQISSNFERLLFDLYGRDGGAVRGLFDSLKQSGGFSIAEDELKAARALFAAGRVDEEETLAAMRAVHRSAGLLIDPHTAVGVAAGRRLRADRGAPLVHLSTAHPAKFPDAVKRATGIYPELPPRLADLFARKERCQTLPNDFETLKQHIAERTRAT